MLIQIAFAIGSEEYLNMVLLLIIEQKACVWDVSGVCLCVSECVLRVSGGCLGKLDNVFGVRKPYQMKNFNICDDVQLHCFLSKGPKMTKK